MCLRVGGVVGAGECMFSALCGRGMTFVFFSFVFLLL